MEQESASRRSFSQTLGIFMSGAGFYALIAGLVIFMVQQSWSDLGVSLCLILGAAMLITGALLNGRIASAFAVPVGLMCIVLPHIHAKMKFVSLEGLVVTLTGLVLLAQGVAVQWRKVSAGLVSRRWVKGAFTGIDVALVLYLLVMTNLISAQYHGRMDLTGAHMFEISSKTREVLKGLEGDVRIVSLLFEDDLAVEPRQASAYGHVAELLKEYVLYGGGRVQVQDISPTDTAAITELTKDLKQPPKAHTLIVIYGTGEGVRERHIRAGELIEYAGGQAMKHAGVGPINLKAEEMITSGIIEVIEGGKREVYFTTGHGELDPGLAGEQGISRVVVDLRRDNYSVRKLNLAMKERIPPDCATLVIAGPRTKFSQLEIDLISEYLDGRKGKLLVMLDPVLKGREASGLEPLLESWGIRVRTDAMVAGPQFDILGRFKNTYYPIDFRATEYPAARAGNPIVSPLKNQMTKFSIACPVQRLASDDAKATLATLVSTNKEGWGETNPQGTRWRLDENDVQGPVPLVVAAKQKDPSRQSDYEGARIVVFGDSDVIMNRFAGVANETLFVNSVNWLTEQEGKLGILPKTMKVGTISYSDAQRVIIFYLTVIGVPGIALVAGCIVYFIRRS